nr:tRNA-dihydrouridine(20) synthase [NAD(P)+]-like isoform X2 [Tanacetum cinerariifolium]
MAAIDVNMGYPKAFSISGGMGAARSTKPDLIHDNWRRIEKIRVSVVGVHGRRVADRPRDPANWSEIATVVDVLSIPVITDGDVFEHDDFQRIQTVTCASSVMVARGAILNASVFHPQGTPIEVVKKSMLGRRRYVDDEVHSPPEHPKEIYNLDTATKLARAKPNKRSEDADLLKDKSGLETPLEFRRSVRAFIMGEVAAGSAEMVRPSQRDNGYVHPAWTEGPESARNRGSTREARRNMGVYTPYPRKDTFTPLTKTPKEILA